MSNEPDFNMAIAEAETILTQRSADPSSITRALRYAYYAVGQSRWRRAEDKNRALAALDRAIDRAERQWG